MKQYRILDDKQISDMMLRIKELVDACQSFLNLLQHAKGSITIEAPSESIEVKEGDKVSVSRRKRPKIADVIFEHIDEQTFTVREAYLVIKDHIEFKTTRYIDSIRVALIRDDRFEEVGKGKYRKLVKPKREGKLFENK